jgi:hypothetical protein
VPQYCTAVVALLPILGGANPGTPNEVAPRKHCPRGDHQDLQLFGWGKPDRVVQTAGCCTLIRLGTEERKAILASMPHCDEWGLVAAPVAPEVA